MWRRHLVESYLTIVINNNNNTTSIYFQLTQTQLHFTTVSTVLVNVFEEQKFLI